MKKLAFYTLLLLSAPCIALADHHGDMMSKVDENNDGKISKAEHAKHAEQKFVKSDANSDGFLDKAEQEAMLKHMHDKHHHAEKAVDDSKDTTANSKESTK